MTTSSLPHDPPRGAGRSRPSARALVLTLAAAAAVYAVGYARTAGVRTNSVAPSTTRTDYRDGTFSAWGRSRHGRVQATVIIRRGRIASVEISDCRMKYPCSMIAGLPPQALSRQGAEVDVVSGATNSTQAFVAALDAALAQAAAGRTP